MSTKIIEQAFFDELKRNGLPLPTKEYTFDKLAGRKWRFDYAWPEPKVAVELQGGIWMDDREGAHTSPTNRLRDMEKYNSATIQGWRVLECTRSSSETKSVKNVGELHIYSKTIINALKILLH